MCLYPKLIPNKRYLPTKKNGGVRMSEENRQTPNAYFLTLTIDDKSYKQLKQKYKLKDNNHIVAYLFFDVFIFKIDVAFNCCVANFTLFSSVNYVYNFGGR